MAAFSPIVRERLSSLVESFPILRGYRGVRPFHLPTILRTFHTEHDAMTATLLASGPPGPPNLAAVVARKHVIAFLLRLHAHMVVKLPPSSPLADGFDAVGALLTWAEPERVAFLAWAETMWVPVGRNAARAEPPVVH
jgi:hypothetical protein